jgi:hypothetical protein
MNIAHKLADLILKPDTAPGTEFVTIGPECFAGIIPGRGTVISWRGENYVPQLPSWRVRLHNWLVKIGSPPHETPELREGPLLSQAAIDWMTADSADGYNEGYVIRPGGLS